MNLHNRLWVGIVILMLGVISSLLTLGWLWRFLLIVKGTRLAAMGLLGSRFSPDFSSPVPDDQDEDYLETRSYA